MCEQEHHGVVKCALGWACWKNYASRSEVDKLRGRAMTTLAGGLRENDFYAEALAIYESRLGTLERLDLDSHIEDMILTAKTNIAACLTDLGRNDEAFEMKKFIYDRKKKLYGSSDMATLVSATHLYASWDTDDAYLVERQSFARKQSRVARRALGPDHEITLRLRSQYARSLLIRSSTPPRSDWLEAIEVAEDVVTTSRRVMGTSHPLTTHFQEMLERAKELVRIATSTPADASASPEPVDGPADPAPAKS